MENDLIPYCHWYNPELLANQSRLLNPALAQNEKQLPSWTLLTTLFKIMKVRKKTMILLAKIYLCLRIQRIKIQSSLHCLFQQGERKSHASIMMRPNDEPMYALMEKVTTALEKVPTADLIKHFERENELTRQHEIPLFSMIFGQQPPDTSQVTQKVNQVQANNTCPPKISDSQSCQPNANIMQQRRLNQTVVCSGCQLPRSQANISQHP